MKAPVITILNSQDLELGRQIAEAVGGTVESRADVGGDFHFTDLAAHLRQRFAEGVPIVAVMAAGAIIRILAPDIRNKLEEPPVVAVAADASAVVPLLGGHRGGNGLARTIGEAIGAPAAITTAGDLKLGVALDSPPPGYRLANPRDAKPVMAKLVAGAAARLEGRADWLSNSGIRFDEGADIALRVTHEDAEPAANQLIYHPASLVLGMGCERGAPAEDAISLADETLKAAGLSPHSLACVASIDLKADEQAIHAVAAHFGVPARFFDAATLEAERDRLENPSEIVFVEVGCHGVAEGAALAGAGTGGNLRVGKRKSSRVTAAIALASEPIVEMPGRARGKLNVVGIGPGGSGWRSPEATAMITASSDLVGYSLYLDLIGNIGGNSVRHDFPLGDEEKRVRHAMELAGEGREVALVCSGDAGIYAMATLVFELLEHGGLSDAAQRIEIAVAPGISALQAAAARAGAPLGHDFCTISLSDLLTPWEAIRQRIDAAAAGDFVIAFYNPVSRRRRTQLEHARQVLLRHRPPDTPVVLAANLGRPGETVRVVALSELSVDDVDMLTVVLVGSSQSRVVATGDGRRHVYTPRGYEAKPGSGLVGKRGEAAE